MSIQSYEKWFASLPAGDQERAEKLLSKLSALNAPRPEEWVHSEISEDIPQFARFLVLRKIWPDLIDSWSRAPDSWIGNLIEKAGGDPSGSFADAGFALKRMVQSGVPAEDIASVARMAAYETAFGILETIDAGCDFGAPFEGPDWTLMEVSPNGELTGRQIGGLHEDILSMDPAGREGRPQS